MKTRPLAPGRDGGSSGGGVLGLWESQRKSGGTPLGAVAQFPSSSRPPPGRPDKAEPFISVALHKVSHQLKTHERSPDPYITAGETETDEQ